MPDVDFVVNCWEGTYRELLAPGVLEEVIEPQQFEFAQRTLLVNNVEDLAGTRRLADAALERGAITRTILVADALDAALARTGLSRRHLRRLPHYTNWCLVAVTLDGPEWVLCWDADARLREARDWLSPTIAYMNAHPEVAIANPQWKIEGGAEQEALRIDGDFAIGYGISDQVFLARRSELGRPIYRFFAPASWRYPVSEVEPIFEQRIDSYMRRRGRLRATYLPAGYDHRTAEGASYPRRGAREWIRLLCQEAARRGLALISDHPALRARQSSG